MQLDSVHNLKQELLSTHSWVASRSDGRYVALGVAHGPRRRDYKLAFRARWPDEVTTALEKQIREETNEVDVRYTGSIVVQAPDGAVPPATLRPGASVGHYLCTAGSVGFFARRTDDGAIGFVSNNHVLAAEDRGRDGDAILHPGAADGGCRPNDVIATLAGDYPRFEKEASRLDCAFARLLPGVPYDGACGSGTLQNAIAMAEDNLEVSKIGRTTGLTFGRVRAFDIDGLGVDYPDGMRLLNGQIELEPADGKPFARPGDSGSLVISRDRRPLGLLFASSAAGGPNGAGAGYANPIADVLEALRVTLLT